MKAQKSADSIEAELKNLEGIDLYNGYSGIAERFYYSNPALALHYLYKAIAVADSIGDPILIARRQNDIGIMHYTLGNNELAISNILKSMKVPELMADTIYRAQSLMNLGLVYVELKDLHQGLAYLEESLKLVENYDDIYTKSMLFNNLGEGYFDQKEYLKALDYYTRALELEKQIENGIVAIPMHNIGRTHQKLRNYSKAITFLQEALRLDLISNDIEGQALGYYEIGVVYAAVKNYGLAVKNLKSALTISRNQGLKNITSDVLRALSEVEAEQGNDREALSYMEDFLVYDDTLRNDQIFENIVQLQLEHEAQQKEREIMLLHSQSEIADLKNRQNTFLIQLASAGIVLFLILMIVLFRLTQVKNSANNSLKKATELVFEQNIQLQHYNERLKSSQQNLQSLNDTKDKFFSIISHDLRSPLNSLSGLLQILLSRSGILSSEEMLSYTKKISYSVDNLSQLLENLLQWSHSHIGKVKFSPTETSLYDAVNHITDLYRITTENKQVKLITQVDKDLTVFADKNMLEFIIRNLVSNAIKFTPRRGEIKISAFQLEDYVQVKISDTGVGMAYEVLEKLFKIKHHHTTPGTENEKGTGLGLILCNEFVKTNNGKIVVDSFPGKGTIFTVTVPATQLVI